MLWYTRPMTVTPIHRLAGQCPVCGRVTGNVKKHQPTCERKRAEFLAAAVTPQDHVLIERATAHVRHEDLLTAEQKFTGEVDDLAMARLLLAMETGTPVFQGGPKGWTTARRSPLTTAGRPALADIVTEGIRVRLLVVRNRVDAGVARTWIEPAPVHLASPRADRPACFDFTLPGMRYRIRTDIELVDCPACRALFGME